MHLPCRCTYDNDANLDLLSDKTVAVIGYGSQGHAHSLNLKESGVNVVVGLRAGSSSRAAAEKEGLKVLGVAEAAKVGDIVMILINDEVQRAVYEADIKPNLEAGNALAFAHGFNIHFQQVVPPDNVDVFMVAPKGPGHLVRRVYEQEGAFPVCWPFTRIRRGVLTRWDWPMQRASVAVVLA